MAMMEADEDRRMGLRALLIAEYANPEWVSVPLEGWSHSQAIAQLADAHLVTQVRNLEAIRRAGLTDQHFTAIDSERVARRLWRFGALMRGGANKGWTTLTALNALSHRYFEHLVWRRFGERIEYRCYDIVHRITPLSPTVPSALAAKCRRAGVPFVLGPLNGGVPWPSGFDIRRRAEREWLSYIRGLHRLMPGYRSTRENAAAIIIASRDTWMQMPSQYRRKCVYVPENAIDPERFTSERTRAATRPIRAVFLGRLVPYKGADMLIEAAAPLVRNGAMTLSIIGDGPQAPLLRELIRREGIDGGVKLLGWVEHQRVQEHLAEHDLFTFPSIREFGGAVVLEAMAVGLVPIVLNYGGPAELVTDSTGWRIRMSGRDAIITQLRSLLCHLAANPDQIDIMAAAAKRRARCQFTWQAKARQVMEVYRWVLGERDKPDFGMPLPDPPEERAAEHAGRAEMSEPRMAAYSHGVEAASSVRAMR
jgi:glycosyltransferase involved in cell wall biosynthesis